MRWTGHSVHDSVAHRYMTTLRIVMPVRNEGLTLLSSLLALQPLRRRGVELVVVDGGSTDATWAVVRAHADCLLLAPQGRASQMNAGAAGCQADVLLFLHADSRLPDDADTLICAAVGGGHGWGRFDVRIDGSHPMLRVVERLMNLRSRLTGIATGDQAMFIRRDVFERLGGFSDLPLMEDIALSARLKRLGPPACLRQPAVTSARRWEQQGVWRTIGLMWWLRLRYFFGAKPQALADRYGYGRRPSPMVAGMAILARAPVAGSAKTRLIPALGAAGAARAQRRFTLQTLRLAHAAALGPVTLWCAPDTSHRFFRALRRAGRVPCQPQPDGDLGARMQHAFARHFAAQPQLALLLIGTDCPVLAPGHLQQAARALVDHDVVLIPAEDGGYVLIGMRRPLPEVFEGIAWSTPQVMAQTRERLAAAGVRWLELPGLWDVDEPGDWQRLERLLTGVGTIAA